MAEYKIDYNSVGKRIKEARINRNMTQETLADLIEVNSSFISNIERGKTKMSTETLANIAKNLHMSIDYLLFGDMSLDADQHMNIVLSEVKDILKDKDRDEINVFLKFCNIFAEFSKNISKSKK